MKKQDFISQWNAIDKIKIFDIAVRDKRTGESTCIIFDISIQGRSFIAQHEALSTKQDRSKKIACVKRVIDFGFSLDENLQELYSDCCQAIIDSEYFTFNLED